MLLEMATGDENMPKGGHQEDLKLLAATDEKHPLGPRGKWKRKQGAFGYGPHGNEPWSLQAMQKRVYALRDFYKRELKGTGYDDPASDPLVTGTLANSYGTKKLVHPEIAHTPQVMRF